MLLLGGFPVLLGCINIDGTTLERKLASADPIQIEGQVNATPTSYLSTSSLSLPDDYYSADAEGNYLTIIARLTPAGIGRMLHTVAAEPVNTAVLAMFEGNVAEALEMLTELNAEKPESYEILANLAVARELNGDDQGALAAVEGSLKLNPEAHLDTEWMHAKVLQAKLALKTDPDWLEKHTVSGIPKADFPKDFALESLGKQRNLESIANALRAHLVPRLIFIKGKDPIVAAMLTELARVRARESIVERAIPIANLATEYGSKEALMLQKKYDRILRPWPHRILYGILILLASLAILAVVVLLKKRRGP
jgi:tetratricopeptide (TPR) repeat protein